MICGKGYKLVKLGDICNILPGTKYKTSDGKQQGLFRFYNSSQD